MRGVWLEMMLEASQKFFKKATFNHIEGSQSYATIKRRGMQCSSLKNSIPRTCTRTNANDDDICTVLVNTVSN